MPMSLEKLTATLSKTSPVPCEFSIGDTVEYTNEYGVVRSPLKVIGFADEVWQGRFIHLNTSCYWFPKEPESLRKINVGPVADTIIW